VCVFCVVTKFSACSVQNAQLFSAKAFKFKQFIISMLLGFVWTPCILKILWVDAQFQNSAQLIIVLLTLYNFSRPQRQNIFTVKWVCSPKNLHLELILIKFHFRHYRQPMNISHYEIWTYAMCGCRLWGWLTHGRSLRLRHSNPNPNPNYKPNTNLIKYSKLQRTLVS
jgi:hypothetical protein